MQQSRAPRPLPLFLELVRRTAERDPALATKALEGLAKYQSAERRRLRPQRAVVEQVGPASLRDCGGAGRPALLVPSLINPPDILDLDEQVSLAAAVAAMGRRSLLLDWGPASERSDLDIAGHIEALLLPLLGKIGEPAALIGYCLGGTMAIGTANRAEVERVITLAAPWRFSAYPQAGRLSLQRLWLASQGAADRLGALPIEVLQAAFWSLDPDRTVAKFAAFAELPQGSADAQRFVTLEDWANEGEPLPCPAARQLIGDFFGRDLPGSGAWQVGGGRVSDQLDCPLLNVTARDDRITPAATAPSGELLQVPAGHVGMVVGSARHRLHEALGRFLR